MFLISTRPLEDGTHEMEAPHPQIWSRARAEGLTKPEYGRTWFVYGSRAEYEEALD